jgi:hypothetical protein
VPKTENEDENEDEKEPGDLANLVAISIAEQKFHNDLCRLKKCETVAEVEALYDSIEVKTDLQTRTFEAGKIIIRTYVPLF